MRRYAKETRLLAEMQKIDSRTLKYGQVILGMIGPILQGKKRPPPPPFLAPLPKRTNRL